MKWNDTLKLPGSGFRFGINHVLILFLIIIIFQLTLSYIHQISKQNILDQTLEIFKLESAERIAHQSAISLELIIENTFRHPPENTRESIRSIDVTLNQILLEKNTDEAGLLVVSGGVFHLLDSGEDIFHFFIDDEVRGRVVGENSPIYEYMRRGSEGLPGTRRIQSLVQRNEVFHVFVPFLVNGEYRGSYYLQMKPDISGIASEIKNAYGDTGAIFTALILFSLLAMYYISSFTLKERNSALEDLYREREVKLKETIEQEKERLFTRRIYHAHHKAEKIMGFIKQDIRELDPDNMEEKKAVISRYSNFVSRVIYDMKTYDPPVNTIRNVMFRSDVNDILRFLTANVFQRNSDDRQVCKYNFDLQSGLPLLPVNEYIIWEIFEPIIQNAIEHNPSRSLEISISTAYFPGEDSLRVMIKDNGKGIADELLARDEGGIAELFKENTSTKTGPDNRGYGCYIAWQLAVKKCGWKLEARNQPEGGACFEFTIRV